MVHDGRRDLPVLRRQRDATRYRILVEIAERQPAVSQREIAEQVGITAQAVSEHVGGLIEDGYVGTEGRGRYEITKEGVDWLLTRTDELRSFTEYVSEEVVEGVDVDAAIALEPIEAGETVSLSMRDGALHATPGTDGATAVAVTSAGSDESVGVAEFDGVLEFDPGVVSIISIPPVGRGSISRSAIRRRIESEPVLAVSGTEALTLARTVGREPDIRFATTEAVCQAAVRGLDVLLLAVEGRVSAHTDALADADLSFEVADLADRNRR